MKSIKSKLFNSASSYRKDENGQFAVIFAFTVFAFVGALACSIDMTNAYKSKTRLQDVSDMIALKAAKEKLATQSELQTAANDYYSLHYPNNTDDRIVIESIDRVGDTVNISARNTVDTYFAQVFGHDTVDVAVASSATYAQRNVDIALVLDTTGSMAGSKMTSLKLAANGLVDTLDRAGNSNLNMSVVPFAQYVNVGMASEGANWLNVPADTTRNHCWNQAIPGTGTCTSYEGTCSNDSGTYSCERWTCTGQEFQRVCGDFNYEWKGCVGSRQTPWNERAAYNNRQIPGLLERTNLPRQCGAEIQTLTRNMSDVKSRIDGMTAGGLTYIPSGLVWGWRTLDSSAPLTQAVVDPRGETDKALILMTDGANTRSKSGTVHTGKDVDDANDVTTTLCENIKAGEITVYTIAYEIDDGATKGMLQNCATDGSKYFDASDAAQLNEAFEEIADSLNELRLTN